MLRDKVTMNPMDYTCMVVYMVLYYMQSNRQGVDTLHHHYLDKLRLYVYEYTNQDHMLQYNILV